MKKSFRLFFVLMVVFAWCNISAQDNSNSTGRIPGLEEKTTHTIINQSPNLATTAYGFESQVGITFSMPIPAGTPWTNLGTFTAPNFASSMTKGGNGVYYLVDNGPPGALYTFDTGTGAVTLLVALSGNAEGPNGIAYNPANSMYYLIGSTLLYTVDINTGVTTLVGNTGVAGALFIDLCFDLSGVGYSYDLVTDAGYSIDPSTGVATLLGPLGFDANFGQGMSYDNETSTIYLSAFNNGTFTGQLMTMDAVTGATTILTDWGLQQVAPFALDTQYGPPCPVGQATNPNPPSGTINVPLTGNTATWDNDALATSIEVFFNGTSVYSGAPITSLSLAGVEPFTYSTTYSWRVDGSDGNCTTFGENWTFTTLDDPNIVNLFCDDFTAGLGGWTITNDGGTCVWDIFQAADFTLPPTAVGNNMAADADFCGSGTTLLSTATLNTTIDATMYQSVWLEFDNDWQAINAADFAYVDVSTDGGTTWMNVLTFDETDIRNTHEIWDMTSMVSLSNFTIRFVSVQPGWDWWWAVDNVCIYGSDPIPVELSSFTATAQFGEVELSWITSTETNNQGFEVQRSNGSDFETIAFVNGHGTTTEIQAYSYSDKNVNVGSYNYRLKQVDFNGTYEYSNVIEVDVPAPAEFGLDQNYPNPFNPSTKIAFQLAVDSKVSLKIFDVLGQEVATLVNTNLVAGSHNVNFDASALNSGVYLYRIEATGIDGANFIDVKKMILTK